MVIDFRIRPPVKSFPKIEIYPKIGQETSPNWGWLAKLPPSVQTRSMPTFLAELKEAGVGHAVVWGRAVLDPSQSTPHEDVAAIVREQKGLFSGFGGICLREDIGAALAEVDKAVTVLGLKGITIEPGWGGLPLSRADDPKLYPIYQRCMELNAILALTVSVRMGPDLSYSNPEAVDRVARDFPTLRIVVSHAFWPWVEQSCGLAFRRHNVYLLPDLYGMAHPGHLHWVEAANTYLQDRMIFGSAYPLLGVKDVVDAYRRLPYREGVLEKVLYKNAARLLELPV